MADKTKVCKHGLRDIWINDGNGRVRMCGWTDYYIGNLNEHSFKELWNGERAENFRKSLIDGSYRFCNPSKCPHCANENLEEHLVDYEVPEFPEYCNLSYQLQCNYACKFCRQNKIIDDCDFQRVESEIAKILPHVKNIGFNGAGEFFCSQSILSLVQRTNFSEETEFLIESNGSLFNEANWEKISDLGNHNLSVAITVHSFNEQTYKYLSGTDLPIDNIISNLRFISHLRDEEKINKFEIATVVCERNFREMPEYVRFCLDNFSMDTIRLRFFEPYGVMDKVTEWFYDVRNPFHPYHDEYICVMSDPIFDNPKVWKWQGETESLQKESHYELEHRNIVDFSKLYSCNNLRDLLQLWRRKSGYAEVALFGASFLGKDYQKLLANNGLEIMTIFDTYACETKECGYEIKRPACDELNKYECLLVTNNTYAESIKEVLLRNKYEGRTLMMSDFIKEIGIS